MVRHQPLQYYEPQLCLSCLTGIYGCRWKRYQRSHDDTTPVSFSGMDAEASKSPVMGPGAEGNQGSAVSVLSWTVRPITLPGFSFFLRKIGPYLARRNG